MLASFQDRKRVVVGKRVDLGGRRALVHCDRIRRVTLDWVLRVLLARGDRVSIELDLGGNHFGNGAPHTAGLRIPADVVAMLEVFFRHFLYSARALVKCL